MKLNKKLMGLLEKPNNIYDFVAVCFDLLCKNITNHQEFLNTYFGKSKHAECNPNVASLQKFSGEVIYLMRAYEPSKYTEIRDKIFRMIEELELQPYLKRKKESLTIIYALLRGIDSGIGEWAKTNCMLSMGPLNREQKTDHGVYFNMSGTLHEQYADNIGRARVHGSTFHEQFQHFRFLDSRKWKEKQLPLPELKFIPVKPAFRKKEKKEKRDEAAYHFKIGVLPVSSNMNFGFKRTAGTGVKVEYFVTKRDKFAKKVEAAMEKAVNAGCNIIVLPEYVVIPEMYSVISDVLKKNANNHGEDKNPVLVFAGSTWTEENNNVMRIFDTWGQVIGEYYKYSPFTDKDKKQFAFEAYEDLRNPGQKCDIFSVQGIGTFLPAICRDVIDDEYTSNLTAALLPMFVIISAWSHSVASFETRQAEFANKHFTSTILANACSAVQEAKDIQAEEQENQYAEKQKKKGEEKIGNGSIIQQQGTIAGVDIQGICRNHCKENGCKEGCVFVLEYDFAYEKKKKNTSLCIRKI